MQRATGLTSARTFLGIVAVLVCWFAALPAVAQQGQDAVYNSTGSPTNSPAFIDASMFASQGGTICSVIYGILSGVNYSAAVIDARALPNSTPSTSMTCAAGTTPWNNGSSTVAVPSTILLPATGAISANLANPIIIPSTWIVPANTRLIGEGDGILSGSSYPGTTIQAASGFSGTMIQFGSSSSSVCPPVPSGPPCTGISVENLTLDGLEQSVGGIINQYAQNNSYVNHVSFYRILGTGLLVSTPSSGSSSATNSGPYSNITFDTGGYSGTSATVCASIDNVNGFLLGTRGIHGLRCTSETNDAPAAVLLDASNNSIEDVKIVRWRPGRCECPHPHNNP
jgi:hypothetical protein